MYPVLEIFDLRIGTYGAAIAVGIVVMYFATTFLGKRSRIGEDSATTLLIAAIVGAFAGAKALAVVVEGSVDLRSGGVYLGGFFGVVLAGTLVIRWKKLPLLEAYDLLTPVGTLGHFFGRVGCLLAGCCYGVPTDGALGFRFARDSVAYQTLRQSHPDLIAGEHTMGLVPTQLFEAVFELAIALALAGLLLKKVRPGLVFFLYCTLYAAFRFAIEYWRFDPERGYVISRVLSTSQFISIFVFAAGLWGLWRFGLRGSKAAKA